MGLWTNIRDAAESIGAASTALDLRSDRARAETSGITGAANRVRNAEEGFVNKITHNPSAAERREQATLVNDQIKAYKEQTNLAKEQLAQKRNEQVAEKRKINEKQIRALRNSYGPAGFLNNAKKDDVVVGGMTQNLGG